MQNLRATMIPHNCWDAHPHAPGVDSVFLTSCCDPTATPPTSNSKRNKCIEYIRDYYTKNYRLLKSKHGDKCLLQDLEIVLGMRSPSSPEPRMITTTSSAAAQGQGINPLEIYGNWGSSLQRRPTRRRYLPAGSNAIIP